MANILVIDDDESLREIIAAALGAAGHTVGLAKDGNEGLQALRRSPPDLVISDIVMSEMDGLEMVRRLRSLFPNLPVIAMSGHSSYSDLYLKMAKLLGARRVLTKPFKVEQLLAAVDEALGTNDTG